MFGLFTQRRCTRPEASWRRRRLEVEQLETRDCPASIALAAPAVLSGHQVLLSGHVSSDDPAGYVVTFSGAVANTVATDANGDFSLLTCGAQLGEVSAVAAKDGVATDNSATASIGVAAPAVSLSLVYDTPNIVTLSGTVADIDAAGATVRFSGLTSNFVVCDASGNFTLTTLLPVGSFSLSNGSIGDGIGGGISTSIAGSISVSAGMGGGISGVIVASVTDLWGQTSSTALPVNADPTITLASQVQAGHLVILSGVVAGPYTAGATVTFSGAVVGSTTVDASGNYSFATSSAALGPVTAVVVDQQQHSAFAVSTISVAAPTITLAVTAVDATTVTLSGKVTDLDAANETVVVTGAVAQSVPVDANGNFSFTMALGDEGTVDATATDLWGQTSNNAEVAASAYPPAITSFTASYSFGTGWTFQGTVVGPQVQDLIIHFGGLPSLADQTTTVNSDGTFSFVIQLQAGDSGTATAQTTDALGQASNIALYGVNV